MKFLVQSSWGRISLALTVSASVELLVLILCLLDERRLALSPRELARIDGDGDLPVVELLHLLMDCLGPLGLPGEGLAP